MPGKVLTGAAAAREYVQFFRDPIGCMQKLHQRHGPLVAPGPIAFGEPTKLHVLAIGPEFNRQVLGDPATLRTTGQFIRSPKDSDRRRIRHGLTRMNGAEHRRQRQLIMPPRRFRFTLMPDTRIDPTIRITMNPRNGMPMQIEPNDRQHAASPVRGRIREMVMLP